MLTPLSRKARAQRSGWSSWNYGLQCNKYANVVVVLQCMTLTEHANNQLTHERYHLIGYTKCKGIVAIPVVMVFVLARC